MARLAIHHTEGSFSTRWKAYCDQHAIPYKVVNCLESNIMRQLTFADALLWHWVHYDQREQLVARQIITSAEAMGIVVFPSIATCWHFDDKVGQKYLLEAVGAPLVPSYVFYDSGEALRWIDEALFPKVFKLRKGAGSANVRLIRDAHAGRTLVKRAFSDGFWPIASYRHDVGKRYRLARQRDDILGALKRMPKTLAKIRRINRAMGPEKGYVYFQDFVPDNQFDTRVTVIGDRAFAYIRKVRPGDFRASGSGDMDYDPRNIRLECVQIAFEIAQKVNSQSMAFDFVLERDGRPMIVEVSYCYVPDFVYNCPGHWDRQLSWHEGHMWPEDAILIDLLEEVGRRKSSRGPSGFVSTGL